MGVKMEVNSEVLKLLNEEFGDKKSYALLVLIDNLTAEQKSNVYNKTMSSAFLKLMGEVELVKTALDFLKNNLNVSKSSRDAFLHRNTLFYRLEKIHKLTGLNLKEFEDAFTFKLLMGIYYEKTKGNK